MSNRIYEKIYADLAGPLTELTKMLPAGYKTTFIARRPGEDSKENSVIMTEDNLVEIAALLVDAPPVVIPKEPTND